MHFSNRLLSGPNSDTRECDVVQPKKLPSPSLLLPKGEDPVCTQNDALCSSLPLPSRSWKEMKALLK